VGSIPIARSTFLAKESFLSRMIPSLPSQSYRQSQTQIQFGNPQWDLIRIPGESLALSRSVGIEAVSAAVSRRPTRMRNHTRSTRPERTVTISLRQWEM